MSNYTKYEGKTYLKSVIIAQANAALTAGTEFVLPAGVVFKPRHMATSYVVLSTLPFANRILVERCDGEGNPLHAIPRVVEEVISVSDECPPVSMWKKVSNTR